MMRENHTIDELRVLLTLSAMVRGYFWLDHGWLRWLIPNFAKVDDDLYRSAHPAGYVLRRFKAAGGKSILSLRGDAQNTPNSYERILSIDLNLDLRFIRMRSIELPPRDTLIALIDALKDMPKPLLVHCKSGADRTGLAVTIYRHVIKGEPLQEARKALSLRYAHVAIGKAGIVHQMLDRYALDHDATGIGFEEWVSTSYDPALFARRNRG